MLSELNHAQCLFNFSSITGNKHVRSILGMLVA